MIMSQLKVEEMKNWTKDECRERVEQVLPKLIKTLNLSDSLEDSVEVLKLVCIQFIPILPIEALNSTVLVKILPYVEFVYNAELTSIKSNIVSSDVNFAELFKQLFTILDCLEMCLTNTISLSNEILLEHVQSLPVPVLKISLQSLQFYKECKCNNNDKPQENLSDAIDSIFNKTTSLTNTFLALWEKLKISVILEADVNVVVRVCFLLNDICHVFKLVAGKLPIKILKSYVSILVKYCDRIKDRVDVTSSVKLLCNNVEQNLGDLAVFLSTTKSSLKEQEKKCIHYLQICNFCLKITMVICEKYKFYLDDCFFDLLHLILKLYSFSNPASLSITVSSNLEKEIEKNVTVLIEPLLSHMLREPQCVQALKELKDKLLLEKDMHFANCLLQLFLIENIFQLSENVQDLLLTSEDSNVFQMFFQDFYKCNVELCLPVRFPGVMCNGKPQRMISFYEHVCTKLCGAIASIPASRFELLERVLLDQLLSGHFWNSLLAADVWTFLGRLESPQMCYQHCCIIAELVTLLPLNSTSNQFAHLLLKRLFNFLAIEHKRQFIKSYPPIQHRRLWCHLFPLPLWNIFDGQQLKNIFTQFVNEVEEMINTTSLTSQSHSEMSFCLQSLNAIFSSSGIMALLESSKVQQLKICCFRIWRSLPIQLIPKSGSEAENFIAQLISLTCHLVTIMNNEDLLEFQKRLLYLQQYDSDLIKLTILRMFSHLAIKTIPSTKEQQREIMDFSSLLLSNCLDQNRAILLQKGLETFSNFSQMTQHESIVANCLRQNKRLQEIVKKFLKQESWELPSKYSNSLSVLRAQELMLLNVIRRENGDCSQQLETEANLKAHASLGTEGNSDHSRAFNTEVETNAKQAIQEIKCGINQLSSAIDVTVPLPDWLTIEIQLQIERLNKLIATQVT